MQPAAQQPPVAQQSPAQQPQVQYIQVQPAVEPVPVNTPAPAAPAPDPWQQEFALWQAAAQGNTVDEYQSYLKSYPNGKFAAIAQSRIVKLTADQDAAREANMKNEPEYVEPEPQQMAVGTPQTEAVILAETGTRREVQGRLTALGFNTGGTDGVLGAKSRTAISQWQTAVGAPITGYLSFEQLVRLRADSETVYQQWLASRPVRPSRPVRSRHDELVGRVDNSSSADAAIALGVLGLAVGAMGAAAASRGHRGHFRPGPGFGPGPGRMPRH